MSSLNSTFERRTGMETISGIFLADNLYLKGNKEPYKGDDDTIEVSITISSVTLPIGNKYSQSKMGFAKRRHNNTVVQKMAKRGVIDKAIVTFLPRSLGRPPQILFGKSL